MPFAGNKTGALQKALFTILKIQDDPLPDKILYTAVSQNLRFPDL